MLLTVTIACAGNIQPNRQIDDAILSTTVRDALRADPDLRRYDIVVNAQGGTVTLIGTVGTSALKSKAGTIAERVDGVTMVINDLRVN